MLEQEAKAKETNDTLSKKNVSISICVTFIIEKDDHGDSKQQSDP